jgi:D-arginine dehydrogenase
LSEPDIVVIGAGIAGASAAAEMAAEARVVLLERESRPGVHATGRSAALFHLTYGGPTILPLSRAALPFLKNPPAGFTDVPLIHARGLLMVAAEGQEAALDQHASDAPGASPASRRRRRRRASQR